MLLEALLLMCCTIIVRFKKSAKTRLFCLGINPSCVHAWPMMAALDCAWGCNIQHVRLVRTQHPVTTTPYFFERPTLGVGGGGTICSTLGLLCCGFFTCIRPAPLPCCSWYSWCSNAATASSTSSIASSCVVSAAACPSSLALCVWVGG